MAQKLGNSRERLTKPKRNFMQTRKSVSYLSRNQSSKYINSASPDGLPPSMSSSNYNENYDPFMNESFRPSINPKSRRIDRELNKTPVDQSRFERLFNNREQRDAKLKALKNLHEKEKILKELSEITPAINKSSIDCTFGDITTRNQYDIYERNEKWQKSKEMKLLNLKSQQEFQESEECTFQPKIVSSNKTNRSKILDTSNNQNKSACDIHISNKGTDKFLHRQQIALYMKEEKKIYEEYLSQGKSNFREGISWKNHVENELQNKANSQDQSDSFINIQEK